MINKIVIYIRRCLLRKRIVNLGENVIVEKNFQIKNPECISIGNNCYFGPDCRIEAWTSYKGILYEPIIKIGDNLKINSKCHIGSINKIEIGNNCLFGSNVMIIDHSHGKSIYSELNIHPSDRQIYSKGEVCIGDNCWLGENVVILPNVHIGEKCIIGANAVVTKDIPPCCVVVGNPSVIVKRMKK